MTLDTDVLIDLEKKKPEAIAWFAALPELPTVSGFAAMEFLCGCQNAADRRRIERMLSAFKIVWPVERLLTEAFEDYGRLRLKFGLSVLDMLIAVTALSEGVQLATFNGRHYAGIDGLMTLQPYKR